ncbi:BID domain-containing T4SS effector [Bartonella ancashensis]|uniref:protein adenylyltransferase n=1 Tax=Bartonella ancashensis TaxID=1318743 RepID=A0A0M5KSB8_9HYPH|nr:BID domain-containing T4SS effector [Bartonella ancashensis]ALE03036.1 hypothetical protein PU02_0222 [Bartonella ancashensis]ARE31037.1 Bep222 [Bartonella ancashensis]
MPTGKAFHGNYLYFGTNVLKNRYKIASSEQLEARCAHGIATEMVLLQREPYPEHFNSSYLKYLHKRLFREVFEWAGCTRDAPFKFRDGTVAYMPEMKKSGAYSHFASSDEIERHLKNFDKTLLERNNLRGLSRKEFVKDVTMLFAFLNWVHPFRDGNIRTQQLFFERLAAATGHELSFSLVTKRRMKDVCAEAMDYDNLSPMRHMFEDISNPKKRLTLENFFRHATFKKSGVENRHIVVAREGIRVTGTFAGIKEEMFLINTGNTLVICPVKELQKYQLQDLRHGDLMIFTPREAPEILIPEKNIGPLQERELSEMIAKDDLVQKSIREIRKLSQTIYTNPAILDEKIKDIQLNQDLAQKLTQQIKRNPESFARLAGKRYLCLRNGARRNAERAVSCLVNSIANHGEIIKCVRERSIKKYQKEQERMGTAVEIPSERLRDLFSSSERQQEKILFEDTSVRKELNVYMRALNARLSKSEHAAIESGDYTRLAASVGVSNEQAEMIAAIASVGRDMQKKNQEFKISQLKGVMKVC